MTRISKDPRNALRLSEDDRRKNNTVIVGLDPAIKERDVRLKAEHDVEKRLNMTSCSQLDRNAGCGMNLR